MMAERKCRSVLIHINDSIPSPRALRLVLAFLLLLTGTVSPSWADAPALDRLYPPAIATGKISAVTAEGKFPTWPVEIFCDRVDLAVTCEAENGRLSVNATQATVPGVAWIRFSDTQGASNLVPLLIETRPVVAEIEPNDTVSESMNVPLPTTLAGRLEKSGDVDCYQVELPANGSLHARLIGKQILNSGMDAVMQLVDAHGNVLLQSDDEVGIDPQLVYTTKQAQEVHLRVFAFPETPNSTIGFAGSPAFCYTLQLSTQPTIDHFLPLVHSPALQPVAYDTQLNAHAATLFGATQSSPAVAYSQTAWQWSPRVAVEDCDAILELADKTQTATRLPLLFSGHISLPGESDSVRFPAVARKKLRAQVISRQHGFPLDSVVEIIDPANGEVIARGDDAGRNDYDAQLDFTPKTDGELELRISDLAGSASLRHAYSVLLAEVVPAVKLTIDTDHFTIQPGASLEIGIGITRQDGFDQTLEVTATDLPDGVAVSPVVSEPKGDSAKTVKLKLLAEESVPPKHCQFRIQATIKNAANASPMHATYSLRPTVDTHVFWLTVSRAD